MAARDYNYVSLNGARIAYRVSGEGPVLVLMHNNRRPLVFPASVGLDHGACGLGDPSSSGRRVAQAVVDRLGRSLPDGW